MKLQQLLDNKQFDNEILLCHGCENHCTVKKYSFSNGNSFYSGNQCERIYGNSQNQDVKGVNLLKEKNQLLFKRPIERLEKATRIGIPRALGIYENYPFWHTLFSTCGLRVVLSHQSSNNLYEKGIRSIVADNICFPAKLMHGHIMDLLQQGVDRIFYPWVVFEQMEDKKAKNSFNCPIVSGYSDVIQSSIDIEKNYGVKLDAPVVSFKEEKLLRASCLDYLQLLGIEKSLANKAITAAIQEQVNYLNKLEQRSLEVLHKAEQEQRMVVLLAGRPYHTDPLIEHKISQVIADMGIDVITEHVARKQGSAVYEELNALCQWNYPNRIFKAAYFCAKHSYKNLFMVQLTCFGCGPDAFIIDEVRSILARYHKNLTLLKIDDVNNIGSLRLRIRSLVDSVKQSNTTAEEPLASVTTKEFTPEERHRTLLVPYFAEGYSEFLPTLLKMAGYKTVMLPMCVKEDAEQGLQVANNDVCYPATLVIGSLLRALKSGDYDLDNTAVIITQTGGQCRASNYYALIKNALVNAGLECVPVISLATGKSLGNQQSGWELNWRKMAKIVLHTLHYADCIAKLYYPSVVREKTKGEALRLRNHYINAAFPIIEKKDTKALKSLLSQAVKDFSSIIDKDKNVPVVGVVGEIYVKYNSFSNKDVVGWLISHGIEVVPPALTGFFSTSLVSAHVNKELNIKSLSTPIFVMDALHKLVSVVAKSYDKICKDFPFYRDFVDIRDYHKASTKVISSAADFGEGWFLPGEVCHMAEHGIDKVVSLQPFGCIANHIISKGIEKRLKTLYPNLSLLFLDFDAGSSEANVYNRLHFMLN